MIYDCYFLIRVKDYKVMAASTENDFFNALPQYFQDITGQPIGNMRYDQALKKIGHIVAKQTIPSR